MPSDVHSSQRRPTPLVVLSGGLVSHVHTVMGFLAFFGALLTALSLHYHKVVKNHVAQYPEEWWPSVSATIGDWYPERNIFQVGIALMAGPRFVLVLLSALLVSLSTSTRSSKAFVLLLVGVLRTFACGGWVYVTSTDDHLIHDIAMFVYLALTPPWMFITSGSLAQPRSGKAVAYTHDTLASKARKMRRIACFSFFACTPFMGFFFYRHNALRIPGAYSYYAYFEWGLIIFVSLKLLPRFSVYDPLLIPFAAPCLLDAVRTSYSMQRAYTTFRASRFTLSKLPSPKPLQRVKMQRKEQKDDDFLMAPGSAEDESKRLRRELGQLPTHHQTGTISCRAVDTLTDAGDRQ